jgi:hypothetical protein
MRPSATATLPDPTGSYLTMVFPQHPRNASNPPNWMAWQQYFVAIQITLSGTDCDVVYGVQAASVPYTQNGNDPHSGNLQFTLTINSCECDFNVNVYDPPGPGFIVEGTVIIHLASGPYTFETRLLKLPIGLPAGSYTVSSSSNSAISGALTLGATSSTFQQTGEPSQTITPVWNGTGTPQRPMLSFSATIVSGGGSIVYNFIALFDPQWSSGRYTAHFHGVASSTDDGGDSDLTATLNAPEPIPDCGKGHASD